MGVQKQLYWGKNSEKKTVMIVKIKYGFAKNNYHFDMTEILFLKNLSGKIFFFR